MSPLVTGFAWLLVFQCAGEAIAWFTGAPIPGPVIGMALLFAALLMSRKARGALDVAADGLARHLSLLFVPAGVGVMLHVARVVDEWLPIVVALAVSTALAIAATALTFQWLTRRGQSADRESAR